jgi:uncharacterized protein YjiS (DUF1127 family)
MGIIIIDFGDQRNSFLLLCRREQIAGVGKPLEDSAMSAHLSPAPFARTIAHGGPHLVLALRLAWRRFRRAYAVALRDEVSRRNLHRLDDRMLADIGVSRAQAHYEAERKPWHYI